ncbi:hypothetical protein PV08_05361 [Exophiala spinifera]|uniref:Transcription factor domain-containing protein n=1 Tax=Exophiala spinifera TaxID=91928 RepID=A0A0D1YK07_9EURO|nr:uncharacterized protein PV08_05361 [Exophiala spinifera]KIW15316.1 hypothetical protein PV08_05361 [Exophiala spinifera]
MATLQLTPRTTSNPGDQLPLLFITNNPRRYSYTLCTNDAKAVASHVSARYRAWSKTNRRSLALDSTTRAILAARNSALQNPGSSKPLKAGANGTAYAETVERLKRYHHAMSTRRRRSFAETLQSDRDESNSDTWSMFADIVSPHITQLGSQFFDPFTATNVKFDREIKSTLHFYFTVIQPFAISLMPSWHWIDNLSRLQRTPVLCYAVAAFTSMFLSGFLNGGPGVVLPPADEEGERSLWSIPAWLRLQTSCLTKLNTVLFRQPSPEITEECYEAILFLFRMSVFLADGESTRLHYKILKRIAPTAGKNKFNLLQELAVMKVNLACIFMFQHSIIPLRTSEQEVSEYPGIEIGRAAWSSEREWQNHRAIVSARLLAWRVEEPGDKLQSETGSTILRLDLSSKLLASRESTEIQRCFQMAVFLIMYLHNIDFNTKAPRVRSSLTMLRKKLAEIGLCHIRKTCTYTLFIVLLAGAMTTRGCPERSWFIERLAALYLEVRCMDDVHKMLVEFIDPLSLIISVLREVWEEVVDFRSVTLVQSREMDLIMGRHHLGCS